MSIYLSIYLLGALVGHARQLHDLIACSETRSVGARSIRNASTPLLLLTIKFANWSLVQSSSRQGLPPTEGLPPNRSYFISR